MLNRSRNRRREPEFGWAGGHRQVDAWAENFGREAVFPVVFQYFS